LPDFLDFFGNEPAELGGRTRRHHATQIGEPSLRLGVGEGCVDVISPTFPTSVTARGQGAPQSKPALFNFGP